MTDRELMQQALEALETCSEDEWYNDDDFGMAQVYDEEKTTEAITALRERLAQPEQEPVVWMYQDKSTHEVRFQKHMRGFVDHGATYETPLYTTPPQRKPEQEPVCAHGIGKTKCSFCHQPQPEQEPVAHTLNCVCGAVWDIKADGVEEMVHAPNPPQRQWQGLARLELQKVVEGLEDLEDCWIAIESALREKNT